MFGNEGNEGYGVGFASLTKLSLMVSGSKNMVPMIARDVKIAPLGGTSLPRFLAAGALDELAAALFDIIKWIERDRVEEGYRKMNGGCLNGFGGHRERLRRGVATVGGRQKDFSGRRVNFDRNNVYRQKALKIGPRAPEVTSHKFKLDDRQAPIEGSRAPIDAKLN